MKTRIKTYQNKIQQEEYLKKGPGKLGPNASYIWRNDPKHLVFLLSRYKFCSKLLEGKKKVIEVGCGDGFGIPILLQTVDHVHGIDLEGVLIEHLKQEYGNNHRAGFSVLDITKSPLKQKYDAAYSLDVIEHIDPKNERKFISNIVKSLKPDAICIIGTPNITAKPYATELSKHDHINLKDHITLRGLLLQYFDNVFIFSMNDEVVHTGFYPMAQYLLGVGVGIKDGRN